MHHLGWATHDRASLSGVLAVWPRIFLTDLAQFGNSCALAFLGLAGPTSRAKECLKQLGLMQV